jgi:putative PIG3 family NAD(P)H quinone oxidoreductase
MPILARAVHIKAPGGPEVLELGELSIRDPGPGEVLVAIKAAGLNRADCLQRRGVYPAPPGVVPSVPGLEYAGHVAALGDGVTRFKVGDAVMAISAGGSMASHIVAHEGELLRVPSGLSVIEAAALPEAFMTAYDALVLQAGMGLGTHVLIHAVGSGVGTAALQLALATGAVPIGTSRKADKLERLKSFGLKHGIVADDGVFADALRAQTGGRLADVVLDTVGAKYLGENLRALASQGTIVTIGMLGGVKAELLLAMLVAKRATLRGSVLRSRSLGEKLHLSRAFEAAVLPLFEAGSLKPVIEDVLPMAEIQRAHARMESDDLFGKLVLSWGE